MSKYKQFSKTGHNFLLAFVLSKDIFIYYQIEVRKMFKIYYSESQNIFSKTEKNNFRRDIYDNRRKSE